MTLKWTMMIANGFMINVNGTCPSVLPSGITSHKNDSYEHHM
jgi:hypothetical protein